MPQVACEIVRWVADDFPGWVQASLTDAAGTRWRFEDKAATFSADPLTASTSYPVKGMIRCVILHTDEVRRRTLIDTSQPDGVTALDGRTSQFSVDSALVFAAVS